MGSLRRGAYAQAIADSTSQIEHARLRGNRGGSIDALVLRSAALQATGFLPKAIDDLRGAKEIAGEMHDQRREAFLATRLGEVYLSSNLFEDAVRSLTEGVTLARAGGHRDIEAAILNNFGNIYATSPKVDALPYYEQAILLAEQAGDAPLAARAQLNAARIELDRGQPAKAEMRVRTAFARLGTLPDGAPKAQQHLWAGNLLLDLAERLPNAERLRRSAAETLSRAAELATAVDAKRILGNALGYLGQVYELEGRFEEAATLTRQALFQAHAANAPEQIYLWQARLARLHLRAGRFDQAIEAYRQSVNNIELVRRDFPVLDPRTGKSVLREKLGPVYQGLADLLLRQAAAARDPAAANRDRLAARAVVERFKSAELEDYFQDECASVLSGQQRPVDEMAGSDALVLYPVLLPDRLELLVSVGGKIHQATVSRPTVALTEAARKLRKSLAEYDESDSIPPEAGVLYDWLIKPIEPILASANPSTIVFVPDGVLRTIPLAAAHDGRTFLVARYAVATAPGINLVRGNETEASAVDRSRSRVLLAGLSEGVQGFPALPGVADEVNSLRDVVGATAALTVLMDQNFNAEDLQQSFRSGPFRIVHLASHGVFAGEGKNSFILTHNGRLDMNQLEVLLKYGRRVDEPLDLLTLSACETAAGDDRAALGLAGVAVKAGARSVLASLWQISDEATAELITDFYRNLGQAGMTKALALQQAQVGLLQRKKFAHPSYWSPFLLIGNWK